MGGGGWLMATPLAAAEGGLVECLGGLIGVQLMCSFVASVLVYVYGGV